VVRKSRPKSSKAEILGLAPFVWVLIAVGAGFVLLMGLIFVIAVVGASRPDFAAQTPPGAQPPPNTQPGPFNPKVIQQNVQPARNTQPAPAKAQPKEAPPPPPAHEPPSATKLPGLIAYWSFDEGKGETAGDASGKGMKSKLVNVEWTQGMRGKALKINGPGSYFDYGNSPSFSFAAKAPFAFAFWVQTKSARAAVLSQRNSRDESSLIDMLISGGRITAQLRPDGNIFFPAQIESSAMNDGKWHHVALTRDGDNLELFLDSISQGRRNDAGGAVTTNLRSLGSERYWINNRPGPGDPNFEGSIDEFCIFGRALKTDEIKTLAGR
jgi:hypothetical protein